MRSVRFKAVHSRRVFPLIFCELLGVAAYSDEDVCWLDFAMDDSLRVRRIQSPSAENG
jgi:hypothetical protein